MRKSRRNRSIVTSHKTMLVASLLGVILGFTLIMEEEFIIGALFLIVGLSVGLFTLLRADKARAPHNYDRVNFRNPRGYTRRFKISLGITIVMLLLAMVTWMDWVWPILILLFVSAITFMLYLTDVKGNMQF